MFKDVLVPLVAWPDPTETRAVAEAMGLAGAMGAGVTALTFDLAFDVPANFLSNLVVGLPDLVAGARQQAGANNARLVEEAGAAAAAAGVAFRHVTAPCPSSAMPDHLAAHARLHDLTIIPGGGSEVERERMAEAAIFGSGRPVLLLPRTAPEGTPRLRRIGVAWDGSRPAARALGDALPLLKAAAEVHVLTVTGEKDVGGHAAAHLRRHLACHGIEIRPEDLKTGGATVDATLADYARMAGLDLLVMGAFGHNRTREFVLGGVTRRILDNPPLPVLLAH